VRWRIVALLLAYSFMSWFNRTSMPVAYDEQIQGELPISTRAMGFVYSALLVAYMLCMTPGGWLADRRGPWYALVLMGFGSGLFCALTGVVGWVSQVTLVVLVLLLVVRSVMGVFTAPIYPASGRIIAHWLPFRQRAMVNGLVMAAALVGISCTFHGFGWLVDQVRWPLAFVITGCVTALLALAWTWYGRDFPRQHADVNDAEVFWIEGNYPKPPGISPVAAPQGSWSDLLHNRSLILLTLSYAAVGYFEYLFYFWSNHYFKDVLKLPESRSYATITNLSMAAGMALGGWLSDWLQRRLGYRFGRAVVPVGGMLTGAVLLLAGIWASEPGWIVTFFALAMAAVGATEGPFWATAIDLGGRRGATAAGIFNTGGNAGGALAPMLTPFVSEAFGWEWGIGLGAAVCLVGVCFWWWIDPSEGRSTADTMVQEASPSDAAFV
jgi:sugar phosphate permease